MAALLRIDKGFVMRVIVVMAAAAVLAGCATKNYGRLQPLSSMEMSSYSCRDIALELSKVDAFDTEMKAQAGFNFRSAIANVNDLGIGNAMEKSAAEKSSIARRRQLDMLAAQKGCNPPAP